MQTRFRLSKLVLYLKLSLKDKHGTPMLEMSTKFPTLNTLSKLLSGEAKNNTRFTLLILVLFRRNKI